MENFHFSSGWEKMSYVFYTVCGWGVLCIFFVFWLYNFYVNHHRHKKMWKSPFLRSEKEKINNFHSILWVLKLAVIKSMQSCSRLKEWQMAIDLQPTHEIFFSILGNKSLWRKIYAYMHLCSCAQKVVAKSLIFVARGCFLLYLFLWNHP